MQSDAAATSQKQKEQASGADAHAIHEQSYPSIITSRAHPLQIRTRDVVTRDRHPRIRTRDVRPRARRISNDHPRTRTIRVRERPLRRRTVRRVVRRVPVERRSHPVVVIRRTPVVTTPRFTTPRYNFIGGFGGGDGGD